MQTIFKLRLDFQYHFFKWNIKMLKISFILLTDFTHELIKTSTFNVIWNISLKDFIFSRGKRVCIEN